MQWVPLIAISFAAFVYVTYEMFMVGLITPISHDLRVSEGRVGLLMTIYAGLVAVVTLPLMWLTRNVNRRPLLISTLVFLTGGIVLQALAANYWVLVAARICAAVTHGLFWSLVNPMSARLSPAGSTGRAVAIVSLGSTFALVLGSPISTFIGNALGWRTSTWILGAVTVASISVLMLSLPSMPQLRRSELNDDHPTTSAILQLVVYLALAVTAIFTTYSYLGLIVERTVGLPYVAAGLSAYGLFGIVGVVIAGRRVDRRMIRVNAIAVSALIVAAALGYLAFLTEGVAQWIALGALIVVLGTAAGALPTSATTIFMHAGQQQQDRASAIYVVTFQVGIASGAALGAVCVDSGYLPAVLGVTAVLAALGSAELVLRARPKLK
ncbi:MFS transporter [Corynebacterium aquatimens]|nr:MFS transporter [Corynebacterium aquatimens]WJY66910.1 Sugar efflux transporter B [Corynebacterium aquatimens]